MKKLILFMFIPLLIMLFSAIGLAMNLKTTSESVNKTNKEYEYYLNKEIYGTEVTSLMNKAINENEKNKIAKDEKGYYIDDAKDSIRIELKMISVEKTYAMEEINNHDMNQFLENFNLIKFRCTSIEYHKKTGKISRMIIEQIEY